MKLIRKLGVLALLLAGLVFAPLVQAQNTTGCPTRFYFSSHPAGLQPPSAGLPVYALGSESGPAGPPYGWSLTPVNVVISGYQISFDTVIRIPIHPDLNVWANATSLGVLAPGNYTVTVRSNMVSNQAIPCPTLIVPLNVAGTLATFVPVPGPTGWMAALLGILLTGIGAIALRRRRANFSH